MEVKVCLTLERSSSMELNLRWRLKAKVLPWSATVEGRTFEIQIPDAAPVHKEKA